MPSLRLRLVLGLCLLLPACGQVTDAPIASAAAVGDPDILTQALGHGPEADEAIAALRASGRAGWQRVLAAYDDPDRTGDTPAWARVLDGVAGQRDAAASRLYWETDLDAAKRAAAARGVPILSLRMLGRLTDEHSCANSRFFRTLLYPDPDLRALLDQAFVLHWSTERPVPVVEIDFGDGRKIRTTTTGNSAHYVLDAEGQVLDVLPGLYDASTFADRLRDAIDLHDTIAAAPDHRDAVLAAHHRAALARTRADVLVRAEQPSVLQARQLAAWMDLAPAAAEAAFVPAIDAQPITISKARVEVPVLEQLGADASAGVTDPPPALLRTLAGTATLSPATIALIRRDRPQLGHESAVQYEARLATLLQRTAADLAFDTFVNEARLHAQIHRWFAEGETGSDFARLNARVYTELFGTPAADAWLGLKDDTSYDGLTEGGLVQVRG